MHTDRIGRALKRVTIIACCTWPFASAIAQQAESTHRLMLARQPDVRLYEGSHAVQQVPAGMLLDVIGTEGHWLWTGRGWVRDSEVVPVDEAVMFFSTSIVRQSSVFSLVNRARAQLELHEYDLAVADCNSALELDPQSAVALCMRGRALTLKNDLEHALADLNQAINRDAKLATAYACRARIWLAQGRLDDAVKDATEAVHLDPKSATALAARGKALARLRNYDRAIADFDAALAIHPGFQPVLNGRGNAYFEKGDFRKAVEDYTAALKLKPTAQLYLNRAIAWNRLGATDKAQEDYASMALLDPDLASAHRERALAEKSE